MQILFLVVLSLLIIPASSSILFFFTEKNIRLTKLISFFSALLISIVPAILIYYKMDQPNIEYNLQNISLFKLNNLFSVKLNLNFFGLFFLLISNFLSFLTIIYSFSYCKINNLNLANFLRLIFLAVLSVQIIALSANLFTSFLGYEVLTIVTYFLIGFGAIGGEAINVARQYLRLLLCSSSTLLILVMAILIWQFNSLEFDFINGMISNVIKLNLTGGSFNWYWLFVILIFSIYGSTKAAMFPMHFWLPRAMIAHLPVSALLHAALVVKSGILIITQIVLYIVGPEACKQYLAEAPFLASLPKYLAGAGVIYASYMATQKTEIKRMLAYSTIAQLNYILMSIFALSINSLASQASIISIQIISHAFAKINLFFCVGFLYLKYKIKYSDEFSGLWKKEKLISLAFLFSSFSMMGIPIFPGFFTKLILIRSYVEIQDYFCLLVMIIGFILSCYYLLPILSDMFFGKFDNEDYDKNSLSLPINHDFNRKAFSMKSAIAICFLIWNIVFMGLYCFFFIYYFC